MRQKDGRNRSRKGRSSKNRTGVREKTFWCGGEALINKRIRTLRRNSIKYLFAGKRWEGKSDYVNIKTWRLPLRGRNFSFEREYIVRTVLDLKSQGTDESSVSSEERGARSLGRKKEETQSLTEELVGFKLEGNISTKETGGVGGGIVSQKVSEGKKRKGKSHSAHL